MSTQNELDAAKERLSAALAGKPKNTREYMALDSRDIVTLTGSVAKPTRITSDLHKGQQPHYQYENGARRLVYVKVDDAHHLVEQPVEADGTPVIPE